VIAAVFVGLVIGVIFSALISPAAGAIAFAVWLAISFVGLLARR
jgi:hypothetical protein